MKKKKKSYLEEILGARRDVCACFLIPDYRGEVPKKQKKGIHLTKVL